MGIMIDEHVHGSGSDNDGGHDHHHTYDHGHGHTHHHDNGHDHVHTHGPDHGNGHDHGHNNGHSHLPPGADGSAVTWRSILGLGISGGLLPCPAELVLLLAAVSLHRTGLGLALVFFIAVC